MMEQPSTPDTDAAPHASPGAEKPPRPRGAGLALLVAVFALAGAGGAGFYAWQLQHTLAARLADLEQGMSEQLAQRASLDALGFLRKELDSLRQSLEAQQQTLTQDTTQRLDALRADLATQQQALDTLRTLTGRDEWLWRLGEIERLLTAAQTRLRLLDDTATARLLLLEADRTAAPLGGEALPLREALQQASTQLGAPQFDREGLALRLTQLAEGYRTYRARGPPARRVTPLTRAGGRARRTGWAAGCTSNARRRVASAMPLWPPRPTSSCRPAAPCSRATTPRPRHGCVRCSNLPAVSWMGTTRAPWPRSMSSTTSFRPWGNRLPA